MDKKVCSFCGQDRFNIVMQMQVDAVVDSSGNVVDVETEEIKAGNLEHVAGEWYVCACGEAYKSLDQLISHEQYVEQKQDRAA